MFETGWIRSPTPSLRLAKTLLSVLARRAMDQHTLERVVRQTYSVLTR